MKGKTAVFRNIDLNLAGSFLAQVPPNGLYLDILQLRRETQFDESGSLFALPTATLSDVPDKMAQIKGGEGAVGADWNEGCFLAMIPEIHIII